MHSNLFLELLSAKNMYEALLNTVNHIAHLTEEEQSLFASLFKPLSIKKGDYFLKEGQMNNRVGFLLNGLVYYFVMKNDAEAITDFTSEGDFVSEYHTFINRSTAIHSIKAIEDCEFLVIDYEGLQTVYNKIGDGNRIARVVLERRFGIVVSQLLSMYMHNPEQRYSNFIHTYSSLSQRIPQYLIAAYVGVKPESLSRIRNRMTKSGS